MQTLKQSCSPRKSVFDASRRDTVLDLTDLISVKKELRPGYPDFKARVPIIKVNDLVAEPPALVKRICSQNIIRLSLTWSRMAR